MSKNIGYLSGRKGLKNNLFEAISQLAQNENSAKDAIREEFLVGKAVIEGSISFYDFLKDENKGKKVYVCNGSACLTAGTQEEVRAKLKDKYYDHEIGEMCCLGRCHENKAFHIHQTNYSGNDINHLDEIGNGQYTTNEKYNVASLGRPILTLPQEDVKTYYQSFTDGLLRGPDALLEEIKISKVRGRGGAGFPLALKLASCKDMQDEVKFLVCNADEGDPGAYSDRYLMEQRPHVVLQGMMLAAYIIGASNGVIYIRGEYPESIHAIEKAIQEIADLGLLGENIKGSGFTFHFKIIRAQGAYICGEETALLSSIEGQRPEVRVRPPYPTQYGLFNKPTVVNNVETLANLPFIIKNGGQVFSKIGTEKSSGTKLVSLDGFFQRPGIYEVDMGTPLRSVIDDLGLGFKKEVKAMHIGGPLGGLVPLTKAEELSVDFESFAGSGFLLGHASIVCLPASYPLIAYIEHLFKFTAHESCGKCFPCRIGSTRGYEMIESARQEKQPMDRQLFEDLLETLETGSLCALGGGLPLPVKNALKYFSAELSPYFKSQP